MNLSRRPALAVLSVGTCLSMVLVGGAAVAAPHGTDAGTAAGVGDTGGGDPFFPRAGNGGYDVRHYALDLSYTPATRQLGGSARITARATESLRQFSLDLRRWMRVSEVLVNGRPAVFSQPASLVQELLVTPRQPLRAGSGFTVVVRYAGTAQPVTDPDGSLDGFVPTPDGAFVASEPQGSPSWFPCNDIPTDKASFDITVNVPAGVTAVSNGLLAGSRTAAGRTTWHWVQPQPQATYLTTLSMGTFVVTTSRTRTGVPIWNAVDPSQVAEATPVLAKQAAIIDYFSSVYGRYPFVAAGAIVDDAPEVGYALETQTRPVYDRAPDEATVAHEISHQWFGDSVTLRAWPDIWLHEGFAEFSAWLWTEHSGGISAQDQFDELYARPADDGIWDPPPTRVPAPVDMFGASVYVRGAMALQALRVELGDPTFFDVLRGFYAEHAYGNATVAQFEAYAAAVSGRDLRPFFAAWLEAPGKPALTAP